MAVPLIDRARFRALFEPLAGRRIGFLQVPGNHGASMIYVATRQMLALWEIDYRELSLEEEILSGEPPGIDPQQIGDRPSRPRFLVPRLTIEVRSRSPRRGWADVRKNSKYHNN